MQIRQISAAERTDTMFPLQNAGLQTVEAVPNCYCITRSDAIRQYRAAVQSSVK